MWLFSVSFFTHFFWLNCVLRLKLPQELLQICVIMSVSTHTLHGWSSSTLLCMIWRLIVPLIKMFIPSTTSLRIAGFKLWHLMMILINHLPVRRVELNWHTKIRPKQWGCWRDTRVKNRIKLKPDGIWMQITMYWPANREVSQNYWTVWHPRAGTKLIFLSWTLQLRPWFRRYNLERSSVSGCLLCKAVENMDWEVRSSKYLLFFSSSLN